eukprot:1783553-Rhodomonas_salina.2
MKSREGPTWEYHEASLDRWIEIPAAAMQDLEKATAESAPFVEILFGGEIYRVDLVKMEMRGPLSEGGVRPGVLRHETRNRNMKWCTQIRQT